MPKPVPHPQARQSVVLTAVSCVTLCLAIGCAKSTSSQPRSDSVTDEAKSKTQVTSEDKIAAAFTSENLMGIWLGKATLNEAKLQRKLALLPIDDRQLAEAKAASFLSTVMAVEYKQDGTLENDLELVSIDGQLLRDGSTGSWQIVESRDNGLVIETRETLSDGSVAIGRSYLKFFANKSRFVAAAPVSDVLQECDAMLVFERKILPDASLAEGVSATQTK